MCARVFPGIGANIKRRPKFKYSVYELPGRPYQLLPTMPKRYRTRSRRPFRRRFRPRRYRRYGRVRRYITRRRRRYTRTLRIPTTTQNWVLKKFRYVAVGSQNLSITNSWAGFCQNFAINDLYKPDTVGGTPPERIPSLTELCSLYTYCRVYAVKIHITVASLDAQQGSSVSEPCRIFISVPTPGNTLATGMLSLSQVDNIKIFIIGNPRFSRHRLIQARGTPPGIIKLSKYVKFKNHVANKFEFMSNTNYDVPISPTGPYASPVTPIIGYIGALLEDANTLPTGNINFSCKFQFTFYTKFWGYRIEIS